MAPCCLQIKLKLLPSSKFQLQTIFLSLSSLTLLQAPRPTTIWTHFNQTKMPHVHITPKLYICLRVSSTQNTFPLSSLLGSSPKSPSPHTQEKAENNLSPLWISIALYLFSLTLLVGCKLWLFMSYFQMPNLHLYTYIYSLMKYPWETHLINVNIKNRFSACQLWDIFYSFSGKSMFDVIYSKCFKQKDQKSKKISTIKNGKCTCSE